MKNCIRKISPGDIIHYGLAVNGTLPYRVIENLGEPFYARGQSQMIILRCYNDNNIQRGKTIKNQFCVGFIQRVEKKSR